MVYFSHALQQDRGGIIRPATKTILNFAFIFATLAVVLLIGVNGQEMTGAVEALQSIGPKWIALCVLAYLACLCFDSLSLYYFLRRQGQRQPVCFFQSHRITSVEHMRSFRLTFRAKVRKIKVSQSRARRFFGAGTAKKGSDVL